MDTPLGTGPAVMSSARVCEYLAIALIMLRDFAIKSDFSSLVERDMFAVIATPAVIYAARSTTIVPTANMSSFVLTELVSPPRFSVIARCFAESVHMVAGCTYTNPVMVDPVMVVPMLGTYAQLDDSLGSVLSLKHSDFNCVARTLICNASSQLGPPYNGGTSSVKVFPGPTIDAFCYLHRWLLPLIGYATYRFYAMPPSLGIYMMLCAVVLSACICASGPSLLLSTLMVDTYFGRQTHCMKHNLFSEDLVVRVVYGHLRVSVAVNGSASYADLVDTLSVYYATPRDWFYCVANGTLCDATSWPMILTTDTTIFIHFRLRGGVRTRFQPIPAEAQPLENETRFGLKNFNNSCYMNAVLQVICRHPAFDAHMRGLQHSCVPPARSKCVVCMLKDIVEGNLLTGPPRGEQKYYLPNAIHAFIVARGTPFKINIHEDADELMKFLFGQLYSVASRACVAEVFELQRLCSLFEVTMSQKIVCPCNATRDIGDLLSSSICLLCKHDAPLSILCEDYFLRDEFVPGDSESVCRSCDIKGSIGKIIHLEHLPEIVWFEIQRNIDGSVDSETAAPKTTAHVSFGSTLDIEPFASPTLKDKLKESRVSDPCKLLLHAVIVHEGNTAACGHYICHVFDREYKTWLTYNDSRVSFVSESEVFKAEASALCYISPHADVLNPAVPTSAPVAKPDAPEEHEGKFRASAKPAVSDKSESSAGAANTKREASEKLYEAKVVGPVKPGVSMKPDVSTTPDFSAGAAKPQPKAQAKPQKAKPVAQVKPDAPAKPAGPVAAKPSVSPTVPKAKPVKSKMKRGGGGSGSDSDFDCHDDVNDSYFSGQSDPEPKNAHELLDGYIESPLAQAALAEMLRSSQIQVAESLRINGGGHSRAVRKALNIDQARSPPADLRSPWAVHSYATCLVFLARFGVFHKYRDIYDTPLVAGSKFKMLFQDDHCAGSSDSKLNDQGTKYQHLCSRTIVQVLNDSHGSGVDELSHVHLKGLRAEPFALHSFYQVLPQLLDARRFSHRAMIDAWTIASATMVKDIKAGDDYRKALFATYRRDDLEKHILRQQKDLQDRMIRDFVEDPLHPGTYPRPRDHVSGYEIATALCTVHPSLLKVGSNSTQTFKLLIIGPELHEKSEWGPLVKQAASAHVTSSALDVTSENILELLDEHRILKGLSCVAGGIARRALEGLIVVTLSELPRAFLQTVAQLVFAADLHNLILEQILPLSVPANHNQEASHVADEAVCADGDSCAASPETQRGKAVSACTADPDAPVFGRAWWDADDCQHNPVPTAVPLDSACVDAAEVSNVADNVACAVNSETQRGHVESAGVPGTVRLRVEGCAVGGSPDVESSAARDARLCRVSADSLTHSPSISTALAVDPAPVADAETTRGRVESADVLGNDACNPLPSTAQAEHDPAIASVSDDPVTLAAEPELRVEGCTAEGSPDSRGLLNCDGDVESSAARHARHGPFSADFRDHSPSASHLTQSVRATCIAHQPPVRQTKKDGCTPADVIDTLVPAITAFYTVFLRAAISAAAESLTAVSTENDVLRGLRTALREMHLKEAPDVVNCNGDCDTRHVAALDAAALKLASYKRACGSLSISRAGEQDSLFFMKSLILVGVDLVRPTQLPYIMMIALVMLDFLTNRFKLSSSTQTKRGSLMQKVRDVSDILMRHPAFTDYHAPSPAHST
jgi:hypothetical protein